MYQWKQRRERAAFLALANGAVFRGWSFGAPRDSVGEAVFNTGMRLGAYPCVLTPDSLCSKLYGAPQISERHRHRYEFNPKFKSELEAAGLVIAGASPDGLLAEIVELRDGHPFFVGCQFHPEFKSRPQQPHPLFNGLVAAALNRKQGK